MSYQERTIRFLELLHIDAWRVKVYTISRADRFHHPEMYENVKAELPEWLRQKNRFANSHEHIAFLILHSGKEGVFSILTWWVDNEMTNTHIYLTELNRPSEFIEVSGDGLSPCIWELAVIDHERRAWMKHFLKQRHRPNYAAYLADVMNDRL